MPSSSSYHNRNEIKATVDTNDTNSYLTCKQLQQLLNTVTVVKPVKMVGITTMCKKKQLKQKQTILT